VTELGIVVLAVYFIPAIIASMRKHHQTMAITLTNVLLGWTVIGWIVALIWSVSAVQQSVTAPAPTPLQDVPLGQIGRRLLITIAVCTLIIVALIIKNKIVYGS